MVFSLHLFGRLLFDLGSMVPSEESSRYFYILLTSITEEFISMNSLIFYLLSHTHNQSKTAKNPLSPCTPDAGWHISAMSRICIVVLALFLPSPPPPPGAVLVLCRSGHTQNWRWLLTWNKGPPLQQSLHSASGQRKPTYWDKEELGELRRKKGWYQHLSTHSSPGKSHGLSSPLSGPRFWHQKSTGIVYLVLFVALLRCHWSLTFSTLFFEAAGGNPQHCISGHLVSEHAFNWQLSAWRLPHLSVSSSRSHSAPLSWCRARIPSSSRAVPRARTSFPVTLPLHARTHCHPTYWLVICLPVFSFRQAIQNLKPILNICIFPILLVQIVFVCEI